MAFALGFVRNKIFWQLVFVQARHTNGKNGSSSNMLQEQLLLETVQLMDNLSSQFPLNADGQTFTHVCTDFCQINEPIRQFVVRHRDKMLRELNGFLIACKRCRAVFSSGNGI